MKNRFISLLSKYSKSVDFNNQCWIELEQAYSSASRAYHNLAHLENMLAELSQVEDEIDDLDSVLFALFYHDIIYDSNKTDNEHQSALLFQERISKTEFTKIEVIMQLIEATKGHAQSDNQDVNLFLDIDLSILGQSSERYKTYCKQIRFEYQQFADSDYNQGRKQVLQHFLNSESVYNTAHFKNKYEEQARLNMLAELELLS